MAESLHVASELEALLSADGEGPATQLDAAAAARLVEGAINQATVRPLHARKRRAGWMLAAALVLTGSAAAMYTAQRAATPPSAAPATATKRAPAPSVSAAQPAAAAAEPQQAQPEAPARNAQAPSEHVLQPRSSEGRAGEDLLERANRLRGEGQYRAAERTYLRVVTQSPAGAAAYSARVAAASLALEQLGDPKAALRLYQEAARVSPSGALAPEVYEGLAQAHRALGHRAEERRALTTLLKVQASGPAAERAQQRLRVLDASK